ncbi:MULTISPECIES: hypothetical protein [unclassified Moraxella]|uniref:hypothetical protein n=1 Tax=unclassified Moraxella TaxID=2685852 RepID=UPI003AF63F44
MKRVKQQHNNKASASLKSFNPNLRVLTVAVGTLMMANVTGHASDVELYKAASEGGANVMLVFDNSGSMDERSIGEDYKAEGITLATQSNSYYCAKTGSASSWVDTTEITQDIYDDLGKKVTSGGLNIKYNVKSCTIGGKTYYDRISRLKMALMPLLANPKGSFSEGTDFKNYKVGFSNFFYTSQSLGGGVVSYPAKNLSLENRRQMLEVVKGLNAETNTPSSHAFAEAGAYMLGTNTTVTTTLTNLRKPLGYAEYSYTQYRRKYYSIYECTELGSLSIQDNEYRYNCNSGKYIRKYRDVSENDLDSYTRNYRVTGGLTVNYSNGDSEYYSAKYNEDKSFSGFSKANASAIDTSNRNNYSSPVTTGVPNTVQCDGNGIYFLTDGSPNNNFQTSSLDLMNKSLNNTITMGSNGVCSSGLSNDGESGVIGGWKCMGEYAKALRNVSNPKKRQIITGTAGFGSVFKSLEGKDDCTSDSVDATNLCKLGRKGEEYGEGGFYYVETPQQLAESITSFIAGVGSKEIPALSTGSMSVPLDALNTQQSRGYAYTPILDPKPGEESLWDGNLKKYFIRNSHVTADASGATDVFVDITGKFATNTSDIWNTINDTARADATSPDVALPQVGGAFQQVFEKTNNDRNLWVNVNGTLTNIKVDPTTRKTTGFDALKPVLRTDLVKPTTGTDTVRTPVVTGILNKVLNFMGYDAQPNTVTDIVDSTTVISNTFKKTNKNIGGVLHSIPQLVTYGVTLSSVGKFDPTTRKDSVLYGSMDGALHLVDDATGKEQFTFIPKEILDLQSAALQKGNSTNNGKQPYGVDAPWSVTANYNISTSGSAMRYAASQIFATGGLRMGGSTYYGLNISNADAPSMVYSVGSNYANYLQGTVTTISGMKNGTYATTGDQLAFSRMGQSWGKPSTGYVKVGGKKVMVNFLPGGYDTCYESTSFKLNDSANTDAKCKSKAQAQGNAVYMVRIGEEKENTTTKETTIDTTTDNGKLLWWASYGASKNETNNSTTRVTTLQKSEHADMTNSIVTEIRTVDRNYDGLTDHIYFADLGGRVWRADINNNTKIDPTTGTDSGTDTFRVDRVVKLLDVSAEATSPDAPPRFYERPLFTVTDEIDGTAMGQITVGTGNRSLPVTDKRDATKPDAIYSFMDREVGKKNFFCYKTDAVCGTSGPSGTDTTLKQALITKNLTVTNLDKVEYTATDANIKTNMKKGTAETGFKHGWYFPLTQWYKTTGTGSSATMSTTELETDAAKIKGMKMFNEPDAQAGLLFVSIFNPNINLMAEGCSATVQGATQRTLMCLPYGNCTASGYNGGTDYTKRSVSLAGAGIVDNIITQSRPGENGSLFGVLQPKCTGANCDKSAFTKPSELLMGTINSAGTNRDKLINPRDWWEN